MVVKIINEVLDYIDDKLNEGDAFYRALKKLVLLLPLFAEYLAF